MLVYRFIKKHPTVSRLAGFQNASAEHTSYKEQATPKIGQIATVWKVEVENGLFASCSFITCRISICSSFTFASQPFLKPTVMPLIYETPALGRNIRSAARKDLRRSIHGTACGIDWPLIGDTLTIGIAAYPPSWQV